MTDATEKFLRKLTAYETRRVMAAFAQIRSGDWISLDVKPLKDITNTFRVRIGRIRIIFVQRNNKFVIIRVTNRDDKTYKDL